MARSRSLVVDASVAAKWHLPDEDDFAIANDLLVQFQRKELALAAPDIFHHEVASAITVATLGRSPRLSVRQGREAIEDHLALEIETHGSASLIAQAFALVHEHGCALYDAIYLALSHQLRIDFITADRKLYQRIGHLPDVVWLGDYTGADQ